MEFLSAVGRMTVADDAKLLEDIERAVNGRGDGVRVEGTTPLDELRAGDVAVDLREDLDQDPPLWRPAKSLRSKLIGDAGPWATEVRFPVDR